MFRYKTWRDKKCFVVLRPSQIASFTANPGVAYSITLEGTVKFKNRTAKVNQYTGEIILLYGTHMCTLTSDSCTFSFQRVPMAIAENQIRGYTLLFATLGSNNPIRPSVGNMLSHNY